VPTHTERAGDHARGLNFSNVPLTVLNGQSMQAEPFCLDDGTSRVGVQTATQEDYRFHLIIRLREWREPK
jgi:hypothetical protein